MKVTTQSGSLYEFDKEKMRMRRVNEDATLRRDGQWVKLLFFPDPLVGKDMVIYLEGLGEGPYTTRTTTRVTSVEDNT